MQGIELYFLYLGGVRIAFCSKVCHFFLKSCKQLVIFRNQRRNGDSNTISDLIHDVTHSPLERGKTKRATLNSDEVVG